MPKNRRVIDADYYEEDDKPRRSSRSRRVDSERVRASREDREDRDSRESRESRESNADNNLGFDINNIDFGQVAGLLKNVDINQISSMISGLGGLSGLGNLGGLAGLGNLGGIGDLLGMGSGPESKEETVRSNAIPYSGDKRIDLLYALKPMVSPDRANLIDVIIQLYLISKILKR